jgi:hypothetical protein
MPRHLTEGSSGSSQQLRIGAAIQLHSAAITKVQPWCDGIKKDAFIKARVRSCHFKAALAWVLLPTPQTE